MFAFASAFLTSRILLTSWSMGFSQKICLPAAIASSEMEECVSVEEQMRTASICFELPSLTEEGLRAAGYHCSAGKAEAALDCCFQNGFRKFTVFLTAGSLQESETEYTLKKLLAVHPKEITLRGDAEGPLLETTGRLLAQEGWFRAGNHWYREGLPAPLPCAVQIGCGPNAVSVFDHVPVRSTADFDFYCSHSDDFEALVRQADPDFPAENADNP